MKHLRSAIFILLFLLLCILPFAAMPAFSTDESIGNETPAQWPSLLTEDGLLNADYLGGIGDYMEDHFAFRAQLVTANSVLQAVFFQSSSEDTVIVGSDSWLYYAATLDDYQHYDNVSARVLFNEAHNLRLMQEWAELQGKVFLVTIAPNKNTLYPDNMPSYLQITYAEESDFERLIPYLEAEGVNYVDLAGLFLEQEEVLYYERDSHWNGEGALLAYNALMDAAGLEHETYEGIDPSVNEEYYGDLSEMIYPAGLFPEEQTDYLLNPSFEYTAAETGGVSYLTSGGSEDGSGAEADADEGSTGTTTDTDSGTDASVLVEQDTVTTVNESGSGNLLMFRDSFGNSLLPYFAEAFAGATFSKVVPYDLTQEAAQSADVIIVEKVERHLPTFSSVAPLMTAIERSLTFSYTSGERIAGKEDTLLALLGAGDDASLSGEEITVDDSPLQDSSSGTISIAAAAGSTCTEITGTVSEELCAVDGQIYAAVTDLTGTRVYEAFCIDSGETDYGYTLYLDEEDIEEPILNVRIIVRSAGEWLCVCEYEADEYEELLKEWEAQAAEILETYPADNAAISLAAWNAALELAAEADAAEETAEESDEAASSDDAEEAAKTVVSRQYIEDCGLDTGYWDITYADGHHEYIDD